MRSRTSNQFSHIHGLPGLIARSKPLISRTLARMALCKSTLSRSPAPMPEIAIAITSGSPNAGRKTLRELQELLGSVGLTLKDDP